MKNCLWLLPLVMLMVAIVSCARKPEVKEESALLPEEAPLLLEEPGEGQEASSVPEGPMADNSRCHVCHINYEEEELALQHARADVGCEECHGDSTPHCSDEDNITPPDIMYPGERINASCLKCHLKEKLSDVHEPVLAGTATEEKYCTDCHGEHRLAYRTRVWDKASGKLLTDDGVRMLKNEPLHPPSSENSFNAKTQTGKE